MTEYKRDEDTRNREGLKLLALYMSATNICITETNRPISRRVNPGSSERDHGECVCKGERARA